MSVAGVMINGAPLGDPPRRQPEGHLAGGVGGSIPFPSGAVSGDLHARSVSPSLIWAALP